ncbi:MAG: riboflavin synthase [Chloroflexota bacterium]|nr:riboflavin synthase [Chloroflexota bacterium]
MFTGIVEEIGTINSLVNNVLTIQAEKVLADIKLGDSISVNGTCLTVVNFTESKFSVDLAPETLRRTAFGNLNPDDTVNLERALAANDRFGGHMVQGHVDATGRVISIRNEGDSSIFRISNPKRLKPYLVEKGFIAVDGISLTIVKVFTSSFTLSVIPYTRMNTNLRDQTIGGKVNLEVDILAKYVENLMAQRL